MDDQPFSFGPSMRALTEKQQKFVLAMFNNPFGSQASWAKEAGYSTANRAHSVRAVEMMHDPRIEAAIAEVSRSTMNIIGPVLATQGLFRIARNPRHPKHAWALEKLANRTGFHETTEHRVTVDHSVNAGSIEARIREAAAKLGVDPTQLLGANTPAPLAISSSPSSEDAKIIEGEVVGPA